MWQLSCIYSLYSLCDCRGSRKLIYAAIIYTLSKNLVTSTPKSHQSTHSYVPDYFLVRRRDYLESVLIIYQPNSDDSTTGITFYKDWCLTMYLKQRLSKVWQKFQCCSRFMNIVYWFGKKHKLVNTISDAVCTKFSFRSFFMHISIKYYILVLSLQL